MSSAVISDDGVLADIGDGLLVARGCVGGGGATRWTGVRGLSLLVGVVSAGGADGDDGAVVGGDLSGGLGGCGLVHGCG